MLPTDAHRKQPVATGGTRATEVGAGKKCAHTLGKGMRAVEEGMRAVEVLARTRETSGRRHLRAQAHIWPKGA